MTEDDTLLSFEEGRLRVLGAAKPLGTEWVNLGAAVDRILGEDVRATRTLPPWDNSAVDGYAIRSEDAVEGAQLRVRDVVFPGQPPVPALKPGEAVRIMTGAALPIDCDTVVMQERVRVLPQPSPGADRWIALPEPPARGAHRRARGEEARSGERLLPAGTILGVGELGLLYAQGRSRVLTHRRPQVALLSTGDELRAPDENPGAGIVDVNAFTLSLAVTEAGAIPRQLGRFGDDPRTLAVAIREAGPADVLLISGGTLLGDRDPLQTALATVGAEVVFHGLTIRPGKPLLFARLGRQALFGVPGNPTSALVTFALFVRPYLRALAGHPQREEPFRLHARCRQELVKPPGFTHFFRARTAWTEGELWATPLVSQTSGGLASASHATHLLRMPEVCTRVQSGESVELWPTGWSNQ